MFSFPSSLRIYLCIEAVDMRKQFNGLYAVVENQLNENPCSGAIFGFTNKNRNRLKILYWDGTGLWVMAKRLEKGRFSWPQHTSKNKLCLSNEALSLLVSGIDLKSGSLKPWYER